MSSFKRHVRRYAFAVGATVIALLLRGVLDPFLKETNPYLTAWAAIVFSAWYGGVGPAILSTLINWIVIWYRFIPPHYSFSLPEFRTQLSGMVGFLTFSGVIIVMSEANRRSRARADRAISRNEETQEELRIREAEFHVLANSIPELCWMAEPDGYIFWYNQRWYEYTGTKPEQMQGWGWQSVHDPEQLPRVLERWKGSIETGEPFEMEFPLRGADGVFRWFLTRVKAQHDDVGKVTRWFGVNTDIHDLRLAREALRQSQELLTIAQRAGQSGMFDWYIVSGQVVWNAELEEVFGLRPGEFGGTFNDWAKRVHPDDLAPAQAGIDQALAAKQENWRCTYRMFRADIGALRWIDARARIHYENEKPVRMVGINVDVTEKMEAERAFHESEEKYKNVLLQQRDELEKRVTARTEELYTRNLQLREMSGSLLRAQDEERRRLARELHESTGQHLAAMALHLGFLQSTSAYLEPSTVRVITRTNTLLNRVLQEIRTMSYLLHPPMLEEVGLEPAVRWFVEGFSKQTGIPVKLEVFPEKFGRLPQDAEIALFRVVQETLTNAYRDSHSSHATLTLKRLPSHVHLVIHDHSKGIENERLQEKELNVATLGVGLGNAGAHSPTGRRIGSPLRPGWHHGRCYSTV